MGVVALPSRVTGLAAISISEEITFMPGMPGELEFFPVGLDVRVRLALDFEENGFGISHVLLALLEPRSLGRPRPGRRAKLARVSMPSHLTTNAESSLAGRARASGPYSA